MDDRAPGGLFVTVTLKGRGLFGDGLIREKDLIDQLRCTIFQEIHNSDLNEPHELQEPCNSYKVPKMSLIYS